MRKYTIPQSMTVEYLLGDHLGSTSLTTDANGTKVSEMRYCEASRRDKPWGEVRSWWTAGLSTTPAYELSNYTFTGQFSHMDDPTTAAVTEGFGLMFYVSRMYDPALGRFIQADSIIPGISAQAWDRYAYANNSPVRYTDPSGHFSEEKIMKYLGVSTWKDVLSLFEKGGKYEGAWGWLETLRRAELEDKVGWYDDYDIWSQVGFDTTIGSGMLTEIDGQLYLHNGDELTSISDAITQSLDSKGVWIQRKMHNGDYLSPDYMGLNAKNYHLGIKDDIDKIDLGVDIFGIIGDAALVIPGYGELIWLISEVAELGTVGKAWDDLESGGSPSGILIDTGATILEMEKLVPGAGFFGNLVSIGTNVLELTP